MYLYRYLLGVFCTPPRPPPLCKNHFTERGQKEKVEAKSTIGGINKQKRKHHKINKTLVQHAKQHQEINIQKNSVLHTI